MIDDSQPSALGTILKAVSRRKRKSVPPVIPSRRPAKCTNSDVPPTRKSTAPKAVSSRKKS